MRVLNFFSQSLLKYCTMAQHHIFKLIWIDMEMTGLDVEKDEIMEVACIITDPDLQPMHRGFETVIHVSDEKLSNMGEWCSENHGKSGLTEACRKSQTSLKDAERQLAAYIEQHTHLDEVLFLSGNTIYMDRMFLTKYMPKVDSKLHYRILDVSSLKILREAWYPNLDPPKKIYAHRAMEDVENSLYELKYYRKNILK